LINLDIDSLRIFVTLADNKSFTLTAERVARTQSTVSAQVKKLEERLGFVVFDRNRRSFSVTPRGELLLGYAREVLRIHDEGVRRITQETIRGAIRLGVTDYFVPREMPKLLMQFRALHPEVQLEVTSGVTGDLLAKRKSGELDVVIGRRDVPSVASSGKSTSSSTGSARSTVMRREKLLWVASADRELRRRFFMPSATHDSVPLVVLPTGCGVRAQAIGVLDDAKQRWHIAYCGQSVLALQAAIAAGVGVGALTESALNDDISVIGKREGFPVLLDSEIVLFHATKNSKASATLTDLLLALFTGQSQT
jgi:DNA-binding transcriptional LysR family regulator